MYRIYLIILGYGGMVMARKSIVFVLVLAMLAAVLAGCGDAKTASGKGKLVGVTMPTKSLRDGMRTVPMSKLPLRQKASEWIFSMLTINRMYRTVRSKTR